MGWPKKKVVVAGGSGVVEAVATESVVEMLVGTSDGIGSVSVGKSPDAVTWGNPKLGSIGC